MMFMTSYKEMWGTYHNQCLDKKKDKTHQSTHTKPYNDPSNHLACGEDGNLYLNFKIKEI